MSQEIEGTLKWRFDISTFQLIGRELITDRVTALFELVKNSYDANARKVIVTFENIQPSKENPEVPVQGSRITIKDDGYGMTLFDVRDKWMVIGTSSKRKERISPSPFNRRCVGEKGIGRLDNDNKRPRLRLSDDQVWQQIIKYVGVGNSSDFQKLEKGKQRETLRILLDIGASVRQLQRLTGLGRGIIQRV